MKTDKRAEYITRDSILRLLSNDEVARVSNAEVPGALADGDEYIDLDQLDRGVRRAQGATLRPGGILPKKAVREATWNAIVAKLASYSTKAEAGA